MDSENQETASPDKKIEISERELKNLINLGNDFLDISNAYSSAYLSLMTQFTALVKAASECTVEINEHYVQSRENSNFNPDFVRTQVKKLVAAIGVTTEAMGSASAELRKVVEPITTAAEARRNDPTLKEDHDPK